MSIDQFVRGLHWLAEHWKLWGIPGLSAAGLTMFKLFADIRKLNAEIRVLRREETLWKLIYEMRVALDAAARQAHVLPDNLNVSAQSWLDAFSDYPADVVLEALQRIAERKPARVLPERWR